MRGEGGSGLRQQAAWSATGGRSSTGVGAGAGAGFGAGFAFGSGMGSTLTLGFVALGALSFAPAGLPRPRFGSGTASCTAGVSSGAASGTVSEFSGIVAGTSAIFELSRDFFQSIVKVKLIFA